MKVRIVDSLEVEKVEALNRIASTLGTIEAVLTKIERHLKSKKIESLVTESE